MEKDFWPVLDVAFPNFMSKQTSKKVVRYSDGVWKYEADSSKGITIQVKCSCGKEHRITLGANLYVDPPVSEGEVIEGEVVEDVQIKESTK